MRRSAAEEATVLDLCRAGTVVPSVVGSDQGWYFIRRIVTGLGACSVYEVRDGWEPKSGWVTSDDGGCFFTKPSSLQLTPDADQGKKPRGKGKKKK